MRNWFWRSSLLLITVIIIFLLQENEQIVNLSSEEKIAFLVARDLQKLKQNKVLPKQWPEIKEVILLPTSEKTKNWGQKLKLPITTKTDGAYRLKILLIDWQDEQKSGVMLRYDLFEIKSENLIWEISRSFELQ